MALNCHHLSIVMLTDSFGEVRMSLLLENSEGVKNMGSYRLGVIGWELSVGSYFSCRAQSSSHNCVSAKKRQTDNSEFQ